MKKNSSWNAPPKAKRRGLAQKKITREQLARAIQSFTHKGGLIRTLPPQVVQPRQKVGGHVDTGIENPFDP